MAATVLLLLASSWSVPAGAQQSPLAGVTESTEAVLSQVRLPTAPVDVPEVVRTLLPPREPGTAQPTAPPAPAAQPQPPASTAPRTQRSRSPRRGRGSVAARQPARRQRSQRPLRSARAGRTARPERARTARREPRSGERADRGGGGRGDSRRTVRRSPAEAITDVVEAIPTPLLAALGALSLLALLMTARSALNAIRTSRLRHQERELQADVSALNQALLPAVPERVGDVALSASSRPAEGPAAGGDFHDIFTLPDGRVGIIVGDVAGHGREALAPTGLVHYTVRAYLEAGLAPRTALQLTDEAIGDKLGGSFATVLAAIYEPASSTLTYATAGHPVPLLIGSGPEHPIATTLTPAPIGLGRPSGGRQTRVSIEPGRAICLFTDGVVEARGEQGLVGREGLAQALAELAWPPDAEQLLDRLAQHTAPATDDATVCLIRPEQATGDGHVLEEVDIGRAMERPERLAKLLTELGLPAEECERAIETSRAMPSAALLRVERRRAGTSWEVVSEPQAADHLGTDVTRQRPSSAVGSAT